MLIDAHSGPLEATMDTFETLQEYCARAGVKQAHGDHTKALEIAEQQLVSRLKRDIALQEAKVLNSLIMEISAWHKQDVSPMP